MQDGTWKVDIADRPELPWAGAEFGPAFGFGAKVRTTGGVRGIVTGIQWDDLLGGWSYLFERLDARDGGWRDAQSLIDGWGVNT